jgi:hypothetical protein
MQQATRNPWDYSRIEADNLATGSECASSACLGIYRPYTLASRLRESHQANATTKIEASGKQGLQELRASEYTAYYHVLERVPGPPTFSVLTLPPRPNRSPTPC